MKSLSIYLNLIDTRLHYLSVPAFCLWASYKYQVSTKNHSQNVIYFVEMI